MKNFTLYTLTSNFKLLKNRSMVLQSFERRGTTRSHSELGSETRQRRQYLSREAPGRYLKAGVPCSGFFVLIVKQDKKRYNIQILLKGGNVNGSNKKNFCN